MIKAFQMSFNVVAITVTTRKAQLSLPFPIYDLKDVFYMFLYF